ncbi:MAG: hypothetical protein KDE02_03770, partial [Rhodobacteraceae bacterium]|nr:hypothetical protein [Paracoccaceae bacterium]
PFLHAALASLQFDNGHHADGVREMREAIAEAGAEEDIVTYKLALAHMLKAVGDAEGLRAVVTEVLEEDPGETEA